MKELLWIDVDAIEREKEHEKIDMLKSVYSELDKKIKEYDNPNVYELGISTGLLMALVVIGNRILDIKGVPR